MKNQKKGKVKRRIRVNVVITLLLFVFMICFGLVIFLKSDFFSLKYIRVENNEILTNEEIKEMSKISIGKNMFAYDLKKIESNIKSSNYVDDVSIKRKFPNTVVINIKEKNIGCVVKDKSGSCYYVDEAVEIIDSVEENNIKKDILIVNINFSVHNKEIHYDKNEKKYLATLLKNISDEGLNNKLCSVDFLKDKNKIFLKTNTGIEAVFLKKSDIEYNLSKLTSILVDLQSQNVYYGEIDLTYLNYALYTY